MNQKSIKISQMDLNSVGINLKRLETTKYLNDKYGELQDVTLEDIELSNLLSNCNSNCEIKPIFLFEKSEENKKKEFAFLCFIEYILFKYFRQLNEKLNEFYYPHNSAIELLSEIDIYLSANKLQSLVTHQVTGSKGDMYITHRFIINQIEYDFKIENIFYDTNL